MAKKPGQKDDCVLFESHYYATLDFIKPSTVARGDPTGCIHLPIGWKIAPNTHEVNTNVISKYPWGCNCLVVADGICIGTSQAGAGAGKACIVQRDTLHEDGGAFGVIRAGTSFMLGDNGMSAGGYFRILIHHAAREGVHQPLADTLKKRKFTDCTVICGHEETPCHRAVLASASPVFETMLSTNMKEGLENRIEIGEAEPKRVRSMLNSMYSGGMDVEDKKDIPEVMSLAHRYECLWLAKQCAESMVDTVDSQTIQDVLRSLKAVRQEPGFDATWEKLRAKVKSNEDLLDHVMGSY